MNCWTNYWADHARDNVSLTHTGYRITAAHQLFFDAMFLFLFHSLGFVLVFRRHLSISGLNSVLLHRKRPVDLWRS